MIRPPRLVKMSRFARPVPGPRVTIDPQDLALAQKVEKEATLVLAEANLARLSANLQRIRRVSISRTTERRIARIAKSFSILLCAFVNILLSIKNNSGLSPEFFLVF